MIGFFAQFDQNFLNRKSLYNIVSFINIISRVLEQIASLSLSLSLSHTHTHMHAHTHMYTLTLGLSEQHAHGIWGVGEANECLE